MHIDEKQMDYLRGKDLIFPVNADYTSLYVYHHGTVLGCISPTVVDEDIKKIISKMEKLNAGDIDNTRWKDITNVFKARDVLKGYGMTTEQVKDDDAYHAARDEYRETMEARHKKHREDLYEYYGVTDNPKADDVYAKAYDLGHAGGMGEVAAHFGELVSLIV